MVPYINYNELDEFYTLKSVCNLLKMDKETLKQSCKRYGISPQKNEVGDWGLTRFDVRKLHNFLYYEDKKDIGGRKGDGPVGMTELLTVAETAALLKTTKQQVRKMIAQQLIPALKIGREWRVSKEYLEAFLRSEME